MVALFMVKSLNPVAYSACSFCQVFHKVDWGERICQVLEWVYGCFERQGTGRRVYHWIDWWYWQLSDWKVQHCKPHDPHESHFHCLESHNQRNSLLHHSKFGHNSPHHGCKIQKMCRSLALLGYISNRNIPNAIFQLHEFCIHSPLKPENEKMG